MTKRSRLLAITACSVLVGSSLLAAPALAEEPNIVTKNEVATPEEQADHTRFTVSFKESTEEADAIADADTDTDTLDVLKPSVRDEITKAAAKHGVEVEFGQANALDATTFTLSEALDEKTSEAFAEDLAKISAVESAEPDLRLYPLNDTSGPATQPSRPNDPMFNQQWGLSGNAGVRAPEAWAKSSGQGVTVAVLDTGITPHPDLDPNLKGGYDFISAASSARDGNGRDSNPRDEGDWTNANQCGYQHPGSNSSWHGTHVSGIIGAVGNNGTGISGVAPNSTIVPVRVLGACGGSNADIADALVWASGGSVPGVPNNPHPADVVNMSLGGSSNSCPSNFQNAINEANRRGTTVVVAAGNESRDAQQSTPANCSGVVTVAAVGETGARSSFSNYGNRVTVAAPGGDSRTGRTILSTGNSGRTTPQSANYINQQGTSQAAPHVAGVVALMKSVNSSLTPQQVTQHLQATSRSSSSCSGCGAGLVDANAAVDRVRSNAPAPQPTSQPPAPRPTSQPTSQPPAPQPPAPNTQARISLPRFLSRGSAATIQLSGYAPGETVQLRLNGSNAGTVRVDSSGSATGRWNVNSSVSRGMHVMEAQGSESRRSASTRFTVW